VNCRQKVLIVSFVFDAALGFISLLYFQDSSWNISVSILEQTHRLKINITVTILYYENKRNIYLKLVTFRQQLSPFSN